MAFKDLKPKEQTKAIEEKFDNKLSLQEDNYNRVLNKRVDEIPKIKGETNYNKSIYYFTTPGIAQKSFIKLKGPFNTFKGIRDGDKTLQEKEEDQKKLKLSLGELTLGNPKYKWKHQLDTIENVQSIYDSRQKVIDLSNDNAKIRPEIMHNSKQGGTRLKILTPKQMLQRLLIDLAQVKAGNNSENLLNEMKQILFENKLRLFIVSIKRNH